MVRLSEEVQGQRGSVYDVTIDAGFELAKTLSVISNTRNSSSGCLDLSFERNSCMTKVAVKGQPQCAWVGLHFATFKTGTAKPFIAQSVFCSTYRPGLR